MAKELFREASEPRMEVLALQTLAEVDTEALDLLQRCRAVAQEAGWREEEVRSLVEIAKAQRGSDVKASARTAREGLRLAKEHQLWEPRVQLLMQCVQRLGMGMAFEALWRSVLRCNLLLASQRSSRNLVEETERLASEAVKLTAGGGWRRRWRGLALYWQAHSRALSAARPGNRLSSMPSELSGLFGGLEALGGLALTFEMS